jgi:hypothetical protein
MWIRCYYVAELCTILMAASPASGSHFCDLRTNFFIKPIEHTMLPIIVTAEPYVVQSALLYMKEEEGPTRLLL